MKIQFNIHYNTSPGQNICLTGSSNLLGDWDASKAIYLNYSPEGNWSVVLNIPDEIGLLEYKYMLADESGKNIREWGNTRIINLSELSSSMLIAEESWRSPSYNEKVMFSSAFSDAIMKPACGMKTSTSKGKKSIQFKIQVPRIRSGYQVCVMGNQQSLGDWNKEKPLLLSCGDHFPEWTASVNMNELSFPIKYKYGIYDIEKKENEMMSRKAIGVVLGFMFMVAMPAAAGQGLVKTVADGCKTELETYCKNVTLGEGRILACLFAY